ncbi:MAG: DNA primase small subunit domain-containing protein [Candidatus Pacearchaeota archaeon]
MPNEEFPKKELSIKENRIRQITHLYYSRPDIQKAIYDFSKNREISPRYFEGFGKRPDSLQYPTDIFQMAKKGATSFHCSEELWQDPLAVSTSLNEKQLSELRIGWDLLIDIDSKYLDYSKISAQIIIEILKFHGIKNIGIKFSGSKGFHILIPWKAFPKEINGVKTSDMFPKYPRIITQYLTEKTKQRLIEKISDIERPSKYVKDFTVSEKVMPDIILVSPRHLFRMPYSLHEKTALASAVLSLEEIQNFQPKDADPMKLKVKNFMPDSKEGEAKELLVQALDWNKQQNPDEQTEKREFTFKPVKLENLSEEYFPPTIKKILEGISDGKKRALFILLNFFRSIGMEKDELEKRISEWNEKNEVSLKQGYVKSQLIWSYRNKVVPPPNFDKDYYKGIGIIPTPEELRYKNPSNYTIKKYLSKNKK